MEGETEYASKEGMDLYGGNARRGVVLAYHRQHSPELHILSIQTSLEYICNYLLTHYRAMCQASNSLHSPLMVTGLSLASSWVCFCLCLLPVSLLLHASGEIVALLGSVGIEMYLRPSPKNKGQS